MFIICFNIIRIPASYVIIRHYEVVMTSPPVVIITRYVEVGFTLLQPYKNKNKNKNKFISEYM